MNRKITILVLCVIMVAMLAIPVFAEGSIGLVVSDSKPHRAEEFTVTVKVSSVSVSTAGVAIITYGDGLEWLGAEACDGKKNISVVYNLEQGRVMFYAMSAADLNGELLTLSFRVKSNAAFASNKIEVAMQFGTDGDRVTTSKSVTVSCDHKYGSWNNASDSKHSRKCSICGNVDTKSHTYDHDCDTTCNDCAATRTTTHSFGAEWLNDETGHWHACTTCGEKSEFAEHIPGAPAGEYTDQICTVCNYVLATALGHQHKYGDTYVTDAASHWTKCLGCGEETEHIAHSFGSDCDTTCDECGYERQVLHKASDTWTGSAQSHWKVCSECGERLEQNDHIWDGGTVTQEAAWKKPGKIEYHCGICDAEWTDDIPALTVMQAMPWWGWMLMGAVGGAVLVVGIGLAIILPSTLRKSKGRFSN